MQFDNQVLFDYSYIVKNKNYLPATLQRAFGDLGITIGLKIPHKENLQLSTKPHQVIYDVSLEVFRLEDWMKFKTDILSFIFHIGTHDQLNLVRKMIQELETLYSDQKIEP